jgi:hypothetical protein
MVHTGITVTDQVSHNITVWTVTAAVPHTYVASGIYTGTGLEQLPHHMIVSHLCCDPQWSGTVCTPGVRNGSLWQQEHEYLEVTILCRNEQWSGVVLSTHRHTQWTVEWHGPVGTQTHTMNSGVAWSCWHTDTHNEQWSGVVLSAHRHTQWTVEWRGPVGTQTHTAVSCTSLYVECDYTVQDLTFWQQWYRGLVSAGMCHGITGQVDWDILMDCISFNLRGQTVQ